MITSIEKFESILRCPATGGRLIKSSQGDAYVSDSGISYPIVDSFPILVDFNNSVLSRKRLLTTGAASPVTRKTYKGLEVLAKQLVSTEYDETKSNAQKVQRFLKGKQRRRLLVVGGSSVGQGMDDLYADEDIEIVSFDIYSSSNVQFVADGHNIPLEDGSIDAVIVQAVLEHVVSPATVVQEIYRVLSADGLVYAETPFMQQVHEGAYDFTRFTDSGHQLLFSSFTRLDSGVVGGPGVALVWSIDYFVRGLFRSRFAGKVAKMLFFWLRYFDRFIQERHAIDSASGCFFLGQKSAEKPFDSLNIAGIYQGSQ